MQGHVPPHAKPGAARHGLGQARQIGPDIRVKLADDEISPVTTGPLRWWFLKPRPALPTPGAQKRFFFQGAKCDFEEIDIEHVVVVHENQQLSVSLTYAAQAG